MKQFSIICLYRNAIYRSHVQKKPNHTSTNTSTSSTISSSMNVFASTMTNVSKPPSQLAKSYQSNYTRYGRPTPLQHTSTSPLIPPPILSQSHSTLLRNYTSTCGTPDQMKRQKVMYCICDISLTYA